MSSHAPSHALDEEQMYILRLPEDIAAAVHKGIAAGKGSLKISSAAGSGAPTVAAPQNMGRARHRVACRRRPAASRLRVRRVAVWCGSAPCLLSRHLHALVAYGSWGGGRGSARTYVGVVENTRHTHPRTPTRRPQTRASSTSHWTSRTSQTRPRSAPRWVRAARRRGVRTCMGA